MQKEVAVKRLWYFTFLSLLVFACVLIAQNAWAWNISSLNTNSFAYTAYDIFVNKMLKGAPGAVAAVALMAGGIVSAVRSNFLGAGICAISSILLYKAPDLLQSLGFTI